LLIARLFPKLFVLFVVVKAPAVNSFWMWQSLWRRIPFLFVNFVSLLIYSRLSRDILVKPPENRQLSGPRYRGTAPKFWITIFISGSRPNIRQSLVEFSAVTTEEAVRKEKKKNRQNLMAFHAYAWAA